MPTPILTGSARLMSTSGMEVGANYSASDEQYFCKFDDFYDDESVVAWFLVSNSLILGFTKKTFQNRPCILANCRARRHPKSRRIWLVTITWNPIDFGQLNRFSFGAEPITKVSANAAQMDNPDLWDPVLSRRPTPTREGRPLAYYDGGLNGFANTTIISQLAGKRGPVTNSAFVPIAGAPGGITSGATWTCRVLTILDVDYTALKAYEFSTNSLAVNFSHKGLVFTVPRHCLFCTGIAISEQRINNAHAWSIEIQFQEKYNPDFPEIGGWVDVFLDAGYDARAIAAAGDTDAEGKPITRTTSRVRKLLDDRGRPISDPIPLNGNGRELSPGGALSYARWRYPKELAWATFPYLNRIMV